RYGGVVTILDKKQKTKLDSELVQKAEKMNVRFVLGEKYLDSLKDFDIVVRSPGIRYLEPKIQEAIKEGVLVTSHTKVFSQHCPGQIIGVTGTKGKGTTSTLIYEMLKKAGFDAHLGGNIGIPPLDFFDKLTTDS